MTDQRRLESLVETVIGVAIGFLVSVTAWPAVAWLHGIEYTFSSNLSITGIFTILSVARGYVVRRFFARGLHLAAHKLTRGIIHNVNRRCEK